MDLDQPIDKKNIEIDVEALENNLKKLGESLLARDPDFPKLLQMIHKDLSSKPELAHMLQPEQVRAYVDACQRFTQIQIVQDSAKKKKAANVSDVSLDDL